MFLGIAEAEAEVEADTEVKAEAAAAASCWATAFPVAAEAVLTSTPYCSRQVQSTIV